MTWKLFFYSEVKADLATAKKWYKEQLPGLEKRFTSELEKAIKKLQKSPELYEVRYRDVRIKHLDVFPFGIHYQINPASETITILGVLHHRQNPDIYYNR